MSLLQAQNLSFGVSGRLLCHELNLSLEAGTCWGILGPNGSGKTTLLHTLAGLLPAQSGSILLNGSSLEQMERRTIAQQLGLLLQDSQDPFPASVLEEVLSGRHPHLGRWQNEGEEDLALARDAMQRLELNELEQRQLQNLSGGERRRVALATLLTQAPALMLLDEPLNHLDLRHQKLLLNTARTLCEEGHGVMMVLHDPNQALRSCDNVLLLTGNGEWQAGTAEEMLNAEKLSRLYGCEIEHNKTERGNWFRYL
jgi:iron complex transport system ATP-binding protein